MLIDRILASDAILTFGFDLGSFKKEILENSMVFEISNICEYLFKKHSSNHDEFTPKDFPNIAPPFDKIWFEYVTPHEIVTNQYGVIKFNVDNLRRTGICIVSEKKSDEIIKWQSIGFTFQETKDGFIILDPSTISYLLRSDGSLIEFKKDYQLVRTAWNANILGKGGIGFLYWTPWFALSLLHCKNVEIKKTQIGSKLQKKRTMSDRLPLLDYHVLDIGPVRKILDQTMQEKNVGFKKALHICRGHFKDFSRGKGLFGKYQGLYWWDMALRGTQPRIVLKDYTIKVPNEKANKLSG